MNHYVYEKMKNTKKYKNYFRFNFNILTAFCFELHNPITYCRLEYVHCSISYAINYPCYIVFRFVIVIIVQ